MVELIRRPGDVPARWRGLVYGYNGALPKPLTRCFGYGGPRPRIPALWRGMARRCGMRVEDLL